MVSLHAYRIVARLRPITRGEQASRAQHCVRAVDGHKVVLATSENAEAKTLACKPRDSPLPRYGLPVQEQQHFSDGALSELACCGGSLKEALPDKRHNA